MPDSSPYSSSSALFFLSGAASSPAISPTSPHAVIWNAVHGPCPK